MTFAAVEAQPSAIAVLRQAIARGRIGQSYLFTGPSGVGKQLCAIALAQATLCGVEPGIGCGACESCRRVAEGKHPDVRVFGPRDEGNRNLQVEYLRSEILPFAKFAPFEGKAAFVIFPEADVCFPIQHPEAANALLKTLEEPRANVHFVLLSERPERLLPTIRSRCQRLRFAPLPADTLDRVLARHGVAEAARPAAIALAHGRADRALVLAADDCAQKLLDWALQIDQAVAAADPAQLIELGAQLASADERGLVLQSLATFYRDVAAIGLGLPRERLAFGHRSDAIAARAAQLPPARAAARVARLQAIDEDFEQRNANPELALDGLFFALHGT